MIILFLIASFFLDGIIFSLSSINSTVAPLFTVLSLVLAYPYYYNNRKIMYISVIVVGVLYDIVYTNTLFLNTLIFIVFLYFIEKIFKYLTNNILNAFIISTFIICFYHLIVYVFFLIIGVVEWDIMNLIDRILPSLIINYIYIIVFYFVFYFI